MKRILGLAIAALIIMATVGFGTWAYFSDTETSSANQITAGTLDLDLNGGDSNVNILTGLIDKAPGESGRLYAALRNSGSIDGEMEIQTGAVTNTGGTGGTEYEDGVGDLGGAAELGFWLDLNEDDTFDVGSDVALKSDGTVATDQIYYYTVNTLASKTWDIVLATMSPAQQDRFQISWRVPSGTGNSIQGDSFTLGVTFIIEQAAAD